MRAVDRVIESLGQHDGPVSNWLVGEPCFAPPAALGEALVRASRAGAFPYPPQAGRPELRRILAERYSGCPAPSADHVVITQGAKAGLFAVLSAILEPCDELIHPVPCYPAYPTMAALLGAKPVPVVAKDGVFAGWPESIADHFGPRTRAVVLSSPSNPTGATLSDDQTRALVEFCRDRGLRLISDEAYVDFRHQRSEGLLPANLDPDRRTVVQVRSASKSWALCGWRLGWTVADPALASAVASRHASLLNPASGPAQQALTELPKVAASYLENARAAVRGRIDGLISALRESGVDARTPDGGFYLWLDASRLTGVGGTEAFCVRLARDHGVAVWPGEDFGGTGHVRLAVTSPRSEDWIGAVDALCRSLNAL